MKMSYNGLIYKAGAMFLTGRRRSLRIAQRSVIVTLG
jgi:hypothetical protein